ncbi:hypothetical protein GKQ51_11030 [Azotobacter chroococcum]|uniref:3-hydroxyacyl-CoA dehydrogenase C-terminal domain-containing protein n=1 Tax=Azotobacter chroococcum TaxID=353 RepID=A0AAP9YD05_9GAMM|nr:hypothetical protein GKQ51_11030 [Azotobacter chroococcum]
METGELLDRLPPGQQAVFRGLGVLVAQGDAADQQVVLAQGQVPAHDGMERGEGSLGAAVQPLAGFDRRRVLMRQPGLDAGVLACIVILGCEIAQRRIASPAVLDRAVQLALGYPHGPLGLGERFGAARIAQILHALHEQYQEPRYRVSPWLRRRVQLGLPLTTPERQEQSA